MEKEKLLLKKRVQLKRIPGKGGWTYAELPEIPQNRKTHFGWVRVNGTIDGVELKHYHLMPMGNGQLFLPVKAEIRKKIGKKEGDWIEVQLYADDNRLVVPTTFNDCLLDEPSAHSYFYSLKESEKIAWLKWIEKSNKNQNQIERMAVAINLLSNEVNKPPK